MKAYVTNSHELLQSTHNVSNNRCLDLKQLLLSGTAAGSVISVLVQSIFFLKIKSNVFFFPIRGFYLPVFLIV